MGEKSECDFQLEPGTETMILYQSLYPGFSRKSLVYISCYESYQLHYGIHRQYQPHVVSAAVTDVMQ